jgi:hypothetical protein
MNPVTSLRETLQPDRVDSVDQQGDLCGAPCGRASRFFGRASRDGTIEEKDMTPPGQYRRRDRRGSVRATA